MAQRLPKLTGGHKNNFPPEADADFDVVPTGKIEEWRKKLNERFGIGSGKLEIIDDPATADC